MSSATIDVKEAEGSAGGKGSSKKKLVMIVAPILLLVLVGAGLWFSGILHHHKAAAAASAAADKPTLVDVPDILTNLDTGLHRAVFVRMKAKIELAHPADQAIINANMPQIQDAFQTYLRSIRPDELHGGEGMYRLREALMSRIDIIASPVQVLDVLFLEVLIQ